MSNGTPLRVGSLFSGIGGFDLGLERAGMKTEFFVECEPYCQRVLAKHWPDVPIFNDIREVGVDTLPAVDVLCGGFTCQDISVAGKGAGIHGARVLLLTERCGPHPQTVYRDSQGRVLMYVRTEHRGGRDKPEYLFVTTRNRVVFELWVEEVPEDVDLVIDTDGRRQAQEALWLLEAADHEKRIVVDCLKQACEWLPAARAKELRAMWKEAQP